MQDITTLLNEKKMLNVTFVGWYFNPGSVYLGRSELGTRVQPQRKLNLHSNSVNFGIKDENIYIYSVFGDVFMNGAFPFPLVA